VRAGRQGVCGVAAGQVVCTREGRARTGRNSGRQAAAGRARSTGQPISPRRRINASNHVNNAAMFQQGKNRRMRNQTRSTQRPRCRRRREASPPAGRPSVRWVRVGMVARFEKEAHTKVVVKAEGSSSMPCAVQVNENA